MAGCASGDRPGFVEAPLAASPVPEPLPSDLEVPCPDPGVREGKDARVELARNRNWGKCSTAKHLATVAHVRAVRQASIPPASRDDGPVSR